MAEDVVADVFITFWGEPLKYDPDRGTLVGFLRLKAKGRSIDVLRSESGRRRREEREALAGRLPTTGTEALVIDSAESVSLSNALALLPLTERQPIYLAFFIGMTYKAAAESLGLPEGTVKSRIRSGLARLRSCEEVVRLQGEYLEGALANANSNEERNRAKVPGPT